MNKLGFALALVGLLMVISSGALSADGPTATPVPVVTSSPSNPSALGAATAVPTPTSGGALNLSLPNPLEEAEKKLREFENEWLPLKNAMFLGGHIIGIMGPGLECLRFFAYVFYVPYLIALLRWFLRKEPWQEIFMGRSGFWLFMLVIAGAWPVYLTSLHELAYITFLPDNGTVREALGMTLTGFAPDLSPVSLKDVLVFIPLLISWHLGYEIILFTTLPLFIIWSGLARNTRPLQAWVVAYVCFIAFGIFWFVSLKAIEWYHGGPEMGLFQSNFARSMLTLVNYVFIGVSSALALLLTLIPTIHLFRVGFGGAAAGASNRLSGIDWNEVIQWLIMLGLMNRPQQYASGGAWPMGPYGYPQLGSHPRMLPPPPVDRQGRDGGRGGGNGGRGNGGGSARTVNTQNTTRGDTVDGSFREIIDDETNAPPAVDLSQWRDPEKMRADLGQWRIEDQASNQTASSTPPQVDAEGTRVGLSYGESLRTSKTNVDDSIRDLPGVDRYKADGSPTSSDSHRLPGDEKPSERESTLVSSDDPQRKHPGAPEESKQLIQNVPPVDSAPKATDEEVQQKTVAEGQVQNPAKDDSVKVSQPPGKPTVAKTYRMGTMNRDHTVDGKVLSASEPMLITAIGEKTVTTSEGYEIPRELVTFEEGE